MLAQRVPLLDLKAQYALIRERRAARRDTCMRHPAFYSGCRSGGARARTGSISRSATCSWRVLGHRRPACGTDGDRCWCERRSHHVAVFVLCHCRIDCEAGCKTGFRRHRFCNLQHRRSARGGCCDLPDEGDRSRASLRPKRRYETDPRHCDPGWCRRGRGRRPGDWRPLSRSRARWHRNSRMFLLFSKQESRRLWRWRSRDDARPRARTSAPRDPAARWRSEISSRRAWRKLQARCLASSDTAGKASALAWLDGCASTERRAIRAAVRGGRPDSNGRSSSHAPPVVPTSTISLSFAFRSARHFGRIFRTRGIGTEVYYPLPLHLQPCFRDLGYKTGSFPVAEAAAREVLALPIYGELSESQQAWVVETVQTFFQQRA